MQHAALVPKAFTMEEGGVCVCVCVGRGVCVGRDTPHAALAPKAFTMEGVCVCGGISFLKFESLLFLFFLLFLRLLISKEYSSSANRGDTSH